MLFYAGAILLYLRFDEEGRWRWYGFSLAAFLLALLSKAAVVMLPVVLLGCIWWLRGRVRWKDFLHSVPFFVFSLVSGWMSVWVENWANREVTVRAAGFFPRLAGAGWAAWFYLYKALLPFDLTVVYPQWQIDVSQWVSYVPGMILVGCFALFWWRRKTWGRPWLFALAYFVVTLFPVLGFFDIGFYIYSFVADHWQYYSIVAVIALAVAGFELFYRRMGETGRNFGKVVGVGVLIALGVATWTRNGDYANAETLWRDNLAKNPNAWVAHYVLANTLSRTGRMQEAITHYERALQIKPDYSLAHNELAFSLLQVGRVDEAIKQLQLALRINDSAEGHYNLGLAYLQAGRVQDAMRHYEQAVRLKPGFAEAHHWLGVLLVRKGQTQEAISEFFRALRFRPDYPEARNDLGAALATEGKLDEAITNVTVALRLKPDYAEAHYNLALLLAKQGNIDEAIAHLESALKLEPASEKFRRALETLQRVKTQPASR
jgi:tetratricopeptide (TPR) repeat protein